MAARPSRRELAQALNFARRKAGKARWMSRSCPQTRADKLSRTLGVPFASVAPSVWHAEPAAGTRCAARKLSMPCRTIRRQRPQDESMDCVR
jgi:hypothetical protein